MYSDFDFVQAKLKAHIHDPNAPELVHFLFTPLALIVDASRDSNYGPNLPGKVKCHAFYFLFKIRKKM